VADCLAGRVTAEARLASHVARHQATHAALNALIQPRHAAALDEAEDLTAAIAAGGLPRPLAGVAVSVKECFPVRGLLTTLGIASRRGAVDALDASIVSRLRAAGAVIVGKANVPQAMFLHETDNPVWGRTRHPTHPDRNPGGSSGGDAALVAAGVVPLAVGTDLAGSIRQPAHACGIAGIVPRTATLGDGGSVDTMPHLRLVRPRAGLLAARVADLRSGLAALDAVAAGAVTDIRRLRIGWFDDCGPLEPSPAIRRGVREAVAAVAVAGATVTQIQGSLWEEAAWLLLSLLSADGGSNVRGVYQGSRPVPAVARLLRLAGIPRWLRPSVAVIARAAGRRIEAQAVRVTGPRSAAAIQELEQVRAEFERKVLSLAASFDAIICPVSAVPAMRHGTAGRLVVAASPCLAANLFDLPAGAVPVTTVRADEETGRPPARDPVARLAAETDRESRGLPVGVQVVGLHSEPRAGEQLVLDVMGCIEQL
jgi:fatty acid amide hydrolase